MKIFLKSNGHDFPVFQPVSSFTHPYLNFPDYHCLTLWYVCFWVFPGGSVVKNLPEMQETQEMWVLALCWQDPLEEGMAAHSNILAGKIPWTEEPGGLWLLGSQRVRHDWSDWALVCMCLYIYIYIYMCVYLSYLDIDCKDIQSSLNWSLSPSKRPSAAKFSTLIYR